MLVTSCRTWRANDIIGFISTKAGKRHSDNLRGANVPWFDSDLLSHFGAVRFALLALCLARNFIESLERRHVGADAKMQNSRLEEISGDLIKRPMSRAARHVVRGRPEASTRGQVYSVEPFPEAWRRPLVAWAENTHAVAELWLFGSRAKGTSRPGSDVDIAISLMSGDGPEDRALSDFLSLFLEWRCTIERIVRLPVSFTAVLPGTPGDEEVRKTGRLLWRRTPEQVA